jgi:hypothetical protein
MAKAGLPEAQFPEGEKLHPPVNGHWEIWVGGLVFSGLAATSFPGWWPRVLPAVG